MTYLNIAIIGLIVIIGVLAWWYSTGRPKAERHERERDAGSGEAPGSGGASGSGDAPGEA